MNRNFFATGILCLLVVCSACNSKKETTENKATPDTKPDTPSTASTAATPTPEKKVVETAETTGGGGIAGPSTVDGVKTVIRLLQQPDPSADVKKLKPGTAELKALFSDPAAANAVGKQIEKMASKPMKKGFPKGDPFVFCASSDDVKAWTKDVKKNFPGGYKRVGPKLNGGLTMCKFKIGGIAFDSLVNINGKWFMVAKPFRAIRD
jgi:hypothetical protein